MSAVKAAVRAVPPAWPLDATVAVNPYLGQSGETLAYAAARLARVAGAPVTMPRAWYRQQMQAGTISDVDLADALAAKPTADAPKNAAELHKAVEAESPRLAPLPSVARLGAQVSGTDWPALIGDRIGAWAAGYFDAGQALWAAPRKLPAYAAWTRYATHDLTPEIQGLSGFCRRVAEAPETAERSIARVIDHLELPEAALEIYFHRLLMSLGGWAQLARYRLWNAELEGREDSTVVDLLAIRLMWEEAIHDRYAAAIASDWTAARAAFAEPVEPTRDQRIDALLQDAAERGYQRRLAESLGRVDRAPSASERPARAVLQAAFCIDVRSEVFRRALESQDPAIETLGFAGFFGLATEHRRFASDLAERRLPALLTPTVKTCATAPEDVERDRIARLIARTRRAWGRFKLAAVSSFAFVEAMGPVYAGKLLRDGLALAEPATPADPPPRFARPLAIETRTAAAEQVLRAMSHTQHFARVVLVVGHAARVTNNPHASGLHCGACGGYSGEVNARLLAGLLNDAQVRVGLASRGIAIPDDTLFVGALHDTTTDAVQIYEDHPDSRFADDLQRIRAWLDQAGRLARAERAPRLPGANAGRDAARRSRDWAEVRPEWGLAGCAAFIAAPRSRTASVALDGRVFLHNYHWQRDDQFKVLELILTAPVVVASWINLQYYGSTVAPDTFGAGNKLLHNVTGGIGVVEGNGGPLRVGLAWQSVHDGERPAHEPLRLSVCIEAPTAAITDILQRHPEVATLFDNGWMYLFALDAQGRMAQRYTGGARWEMTQVDQRAGC
ncbi:MAG: YbcC family protein [Wenzhouxiangellaceae bacterium]